MKEEKIQNIVSTFEQKYREWLESQKGQKSAYEYEKSYVEFMQEVSRNTLVKTTSSPGKSRNGKKKFRPQ